jgi:hypothetical protein
VNYSVASTGGAGRSGTITIAGQTFTVNQGGGCSFSISPADTDVGAGASTGTVSVTAAGGCAWTAKSNDSWVTITAGGSGTGNGTVNYSVAANTGGARSGTLTIAGRTFTVNQASGACTFTVNPTTIPTNALGGNQNVTVQSGAGCAWTATSNANWIDVTSPPDGKGTGNATVRLTIAVNLGGARNGTATIAGTQVTVNQAGVVPCTFSLTPSSASPGKGGDSDHFDVNASGGPGCAWTATSNASWIHITSGASGTDDGTVNYTVDRNNGDARTGTITAAGRTFTVNQK